MLKIHQVTKEYGGSKATDGVRALDGVDLEVKEGTLLALLGPNGAGKTTLIKIVAGLISPSSGTVFIDRHDVLKDRQKAVAKIAAIFEGNRNIYWYMTPLENLNYFANIRGKSSKAIKDRIDELISFFNLDCKRNEPVKKLSRGMQQKVALAIALVTDPEILLLDEPTLGLDVESYFNLKGKIQELAKEKKKTILLATHQMNLVEDIAEEVAIIERGRIALRENTERLKKTFEVDRYVIQAHGKIHDDELRMLGLFGSVSTSNNGAITTIDLTLKDSHGFFDSMAMLKEMNIGIISINKDAPKIENIFLQLIKH